MPSAREVTQWLTDWSQGDKAALDKLLPVLYDELRRLARHYLRRERPDHTLQTTALVHEAYLRLVDQSRARWDSRTHFFAMAAEVLRFFGGLTAAETAAALGVSVSTVNYEWRLARAWLLRELHTGGAA